MSDCATHRTGGKRWDPGSSRGQVGRRSVTSVFVGVELPMFGTDPVGFCLVSGFFWGL
jgi:hypothetical protein